MRKFTCQIGLAVAACLLVLSFPLYTQFWIYPHFTKIVTFEKEVNAQQIATHITKMLVLDEETQTLTKKNITGPFAEVLKEAQLDFDLTKIKVFSARGEVLYSTDVRDVGTFNTNPYFSEFVANGKIFSTVVQKNKQTMEGKTVKKDVVETYIPLLLDQSFIGAFEIYYDITYSKHSLSKFIANSQLIILGMSLLLLLCILSILLSAARNRKKMLRTQERMNMLRDKIPALYDLPGDEEK